MISFSLVGGRGRGARRTSGNYQCKMCTTCLVRLFPGDDISEEYTVDPSKTSKAATGVDFFSGRLRNHIDFKEHTDINNHVITRYAYGSKKMYEEFKKAQEAKNGGRKSPKKSAKKSTKKSPKNAKRVQKKSAKRA